MANKTVKNRLVLNFPGFEKTDSIAQLGRLKYGAEQTGKIWNFSVEQSDPEPVEGKNHTIADHSSSGANWQCATRVVQFRWNDIVDAYEDEIYPKGFLKNLIKYFTFYIDGTVWRYLKASSRYWGFTIFPILLMIVFAGASWFVLGLIFDSNIVRILLTAAAILVLCKWPGDSLFLPLTIADWGFARDMINHTNPEIEKRFEEFAETVAQEIIGSEHDEIIVVGHSFGAVWAVTALALALENTPNLLAGKQLVFLALGSSIPKIALAPKADYFRSNVARVAGETDLFWHEIQTKDDLIAFYKADPLEIIGVEAKCQFKIDRIRFSKGVEKKRYRNMRWSFYRTHRQYILYYDKRVAFDYIDRKSVV